MDKCVWFQGLNLSLSIIVDTHYNLLTSDALSLHTERNYSGAVIFFVLGEKRADFGILNFNYL